MATATKATKATMEVVTNCGEPFDEERCIGCSSHFDCLLEWVFAQPIAIEIEAVDENEESETYMPKNRSSKDLRRLRRRKNAKAKYEARLLSCGDKDTLEAVMDQTKKDRRAKAAYDHSPNKDNPRFPVNPYRGVAGEILHNNKVAELTLKRKIEEKRLTNELVTVKKSFMGSYENSEERAEEVED